MPTYDFRCNNCKKRFDVFLSYADYEKAEIKCTHCGSSDIQRKIGRIRVAKSDDSRAEDYSDPSVLGNMGQDPESMGRMMRKMSSETGNPMPPEFDEVVSRLEKGESPDQIEKQMPDLGNDSGFPAGGLG
jgi:putative FmdB family regulatory protein